MIVPIPLPPRGDLDTRNPVTDRLPGTLRTAKDMHHRAWGPRRGGKWFAGAMQAPGTASLYDAITLNGVDTAGTATSRDDQFRNLGAQFTLDLWFRYEDTAYAAGKNTVGLYQFQTGVSANYGYVTVFIYGPAHADAGKIRVAITTNPAEGSANASVGFTGSTAIGAGTAQTDKRHVRVVRDGTTAVLYVDGVSDGSTTGLSATHGVLGAGGAVVRIGRNSAVLAADEVTFKGHVYGAMLRDGAFASQPIEAVMPTVAWARNVHHYHIGRSIAYGGADHYFDAGRFGAHAILDGASYSVAAAVDNAAPAPCPVQGLRTWTTRTNRTATSAMIGGALSTVVAR